jgi:hypothetical protein
MQLVDRSTPGAKPLMVAAYEGSGSMLKAGRALSFLVMWAWAEQDGSVAGDSLSERVRAYSKWSKQSERTTWRDLAAYHACFGAGADPSDLARQMVERVELRQGRKSVAAAGALLVVA